jgi:hypothetical protein
MTIGIPASFQAIAERAAAIVLERLEARDHQLPWLAGQKPRPNTSAGRSSASTSMSMSFRTTAMETG